MKLVLLPGLDGTGDLFASFLAALPDTLQPVVVSYPKDNGLTYAGLLPYVGAAAAGLEPFVLLAESFSSPLAVQYAATNPPNLRAVVIVAGFVTSPMKGWRRTVCTMFAPLMFRLPIPEVAAKWFLIGNESQPDLLAAIRNAVSSAQPQVLTHRLRSVLDCDAREGLRSIAIPALYIRANQDRLVGRSSAAEFLQIRPQTVLADVDGPHLLAQRQPWETAKVVADWLSGCYETAIT